MTVASITPTHRGAKESTAGTIAEEADEKEVAAPTAVDKVEEGGMVANVMRFTAQLDLLYKPLRRGRGG